MDHSGQLRHLAEALLTGASRTLSLTVVSILLVSTAFLFRRYLTTSKFPTINAYGRDWTHKKAYDEYSKDARGLVAAGFEKHHGPFQILTPNGPRIILPASATDWVKNCKDVDHQQLVHDDFFADYPGFDGMASVTNPDRIMIDVTRTKLSQNAKAVEIMNGQLADVLKTTWTDEKNWHTIDWPQDTMRLISRMSAAVFVGPELAPNPEWQNLTITYTVNVFMAVGALRRWPLPLRRLVHRFLPYSRVCKDQVKAGQRLLKRVMSDRATERENALAEGRDAPKHEDTVTWVQEAAGGRSNDPAAVQLAFAVSALHTTSEAFRQVLLDLCTHQDLLQPLRDELTTVIEQGGLNIASLSKMHLLDSVMKESQRLKGALVGIERRVTRDTTMPDGLKLPRGSNIAVDSSDMWNPNLHTNPDKFDGYRFLRIREQGGKGSSTAPFVSSYQEHNVFGAGKFVCPGRFFVANEMKLALTHVLLKYDFRLVDGQKPKEVWSGFYYSTDLGVQVEVRRRDEELELG